MAHLLLPENEPLLPGLPPYGLSCALAALLKRRAPGTRRAAKDLGLKDIDFISYRVIRFFFMAYNTSSTV
ncbi:MAG: hypothetical protein IJP93_08925, partial [Bacteroidales bacterium]|nr:hypothetical protein [Bacteroidales bacterium]